MHINPTYTTIAHLWHIKQLVKASEWRFVTDKDNSLMTAIYRVFAKEFRLTDAHHFLSQTDKTKTRTQAYEEFKTAKYELLEWGSLNGYETKSLRRLALYKLEELFQTHQFHDTITTGTHSYNVRGNISDRTSNRNSR